MQHDEEIVEEVDAFNLNDELLQSEKSERQQLLQSAMSELSHAMQLLLNLFYLEEMSVKEIVLATDFSEAKVKTGLHRARKELKAVINKKYNFV